MDYNFFIIIPCLNEERNIKTIYFKISEKLSKNFNILFIDDGSLDGTWCEIKNLSIAEKNVRGLKLTKNFGKDYAIEAGLNFLKNKKFDFAIIIDADLQHPVSEIPNLIDKWRAGSKIITTYKKKNIENIYRSLGSKLFYFMMNKFSDVKFITNNTDFMLLDKKIIEYYNKISIRNNSIKTFVNWIGIKPTSVEIEITKRKSGNSNFGFLRLFRTAINTFTSFSIFPIKIIGYLGLIMTLLTALFLPIIFLLNSANIAYITNQTILIIFLILITGLNLISIGLLGLYISKIHETISKKVSYLIDEETE